jgi:hypothetical protein
MAARSLLNKLAARGLLQLPPRRRCGGRKPLRALEPSLPVAAQPIDAPLTALQPLQLAPVQARTPEAARFTTYLIAHHYLGYSGPVGHRLQYLVRDRTGRDLACVLFGAPAWRCAPRDAFIGWSDAQRRQRLPEVTNNARFLILPWVRVPHLASHILGRLLRRLRADWHAQYAQTLALVETFVEHDRFGGTCYRAANFQCVGQTQGRSRQDRDHALRVPIKDIYLYPLGQDFRRRLCA